MAMKCVVVWGSSRNSQRLIPVDDEYYADTAEAAKEAAHALLEKMRGPNLQPMAILEITEEKLEEMLNGVTPLFTLNQGDEKLEQEVLQLTP